MKKFLKNKKIIIYVLIIFFVILLVAILNNNFKIIEKITNGKLQNANEETAEPPLITYQVYDNSNEDQIKTLVTVNNSNGVKYVEYPDGTKLETNNKRQVSIDYNMAKDGNYTFKIKTADNENVQESTVCANDEFINSNGISISKINQEEGYEVLEIAKQNNVDGYKIYYQIGKNGNWVEGQGKIGLVDYDLVTNNLINEDNTVTISAKIENPTNKNIVTISKKYSVNTNSTTNSYEAESILDVLKNEEINTGLYNLTVKDEKYNLRVYSFDGNLNIKTNTTFGTEEDVATASEYAKNMIVLKVNGDLTIDEGTTLTAYASKDGYGGPKGMTIYCTGTLTNNGTIDMTARGAKAVGQNVYLFKNADNTYEYVPAVGADGGKSVGGYEMKCNGKIVNKVYSAICNYKGTLVINKVTARANYNCIYAEGGTVTVNGGNYKAANSQTTYPLVFSRKATVYLKGGKYTATNASAVYNENGKITISGGNYSGNSGTHWGMITNCKTMSIKGGTFTNSGYLYALFCAEKSSTVVSGGKFTLQADVIRAAYGRKKLLVNGGTFKARAVLLCEFDDFNIKMDKNKMKLIGSTRISDGIF